MRDARAVVCLSAHVQGRAVGLNAGGKNKAAAAYYLPLERVVRALKHIQVRFSRA